MGRVGTEERQRLVNRGFRWPLSRNNLCIDPKNFYIK